MLKKILVFIILFFSVNSFAYTNCEFTPGEGTTSADIANAIEGCFNNSDLVELGDGNVESSGFKDTINNWIQNIGGILGLIAILAIAYGAFTLVISSGDDEKLKKGKDIIKWGILGFLGVVLASSIIAIIVNVIYSIGG